MRSVIASLLVLCNNNGRRCLFFGLGFMIGFDLHEIAFLSIDFLKVIQ
uniref:Uncharacterized protein n=1 Tax=Leviviridae sp. TaxID=2027243 RepID=A0A514D7N8_9VIRU|nr:MAG: hypothetical protein H3Rhizo37218_000003 [Leviviridae sp.]QDH89638.1 MAG: hypothetical protein H2Bulk3671_000004 [Leviviridae sp.]